MKILVVGGSGFIGTRLVSRLLKAGHDVAILDKARSASFPDITVLGDVRDSAAVLEAVRRSEVVYNLAAEHKDDVRPTKLYYEVNVDGMRNMLRACEASDVRRVIFTSSVAVYGLDAGTTDEGSTLRPFNDYGKSKQLAEELVKEWAAAGGGRRATIVRPCVVFGEGNRGNVYNLASQIASGKFLMVGRGINRKSMAYVENVAAFLEFIATAVSQPVAIFNYADKPDLSMQDLVSTVRKELGFGGRIYRVPYLAGYSAAVLLDALGFIARRKFSVSRIRIKKFVAETTVANTRMISSGFIPPFSIEDGLSRFLENEFSCWRRIPRTQGLPGDSGRPSNCP